MFAVVFPFGDFKMKIGAKFGLVSVCEEGRAECGHGSRCPVGV